MRLEREQLIEQGHFAINIIVNHIQSLLLISVFTMQNDVCHMSVFLKHWRLNIFHLRVSKQTNLFNAELLR